MTALAPRLHPEGGRNTVLYAILAAVFAALLAAGLFTYGAKRETAAAKAKAARVVAIWKSEGLPAPESNRMLVRVLGTDGGAVCGTTGQALAKAFGELQLANGAGGPGQRAVIADRGAFTGLRAIVTVYCPQKLAAYDSFVSGLHFDDVVRD